MGLLLIIASIGTAVAWFPILERQNEGVALGHVTARVVKCAFIAVGNGLFLGDLMYRSGLLPRRMSVGLQVRIPDSAGAEREGSAS